MCNPVQQRPLSTSIVEVPACPICLGSISVRVDTVCQHVFCQICLDHWRNIKNNCPVCRREFPKPPSQTLAELEPRRSIVDRVIDTFIQSMFRAAFSGIR